MGERRIFAPTKQEGGRDDAPLPIPSVIGVAAAVIAVILAFVFWPRSQPAQALQPTALPLRAQPTTVPTVAPPTPVPATATPSGPDISTYVEICEEHIKRVRYRECITAAEAALAKPDLRDDDRRVLTGYIVTAGMKELYTQPFQPLDRQQHQQMVDTYLSLVERAKGAGVAIDTPLQVATSAFASSHFQLARAAIEQAYKAQQFDPAIDRDVTKLYVSTLYGIGHYYTTAQSNSQLYQEGVAALVASDVIADHYSLGVSDAEATLKELGYTTPETWPDPLSTPLLP